MNFLLDTNAVSEPLRARPDPGFLAWVGQREASELAASVLTLGEIRYGARKLDPGARRNSIEAWLSELTTQFSDRILPIDQPVVAMWAQVRLQHERAGRAAGAIDELLAATAIAHDLTLVTRNVRHFEHSGCRLLCPWSG